MSYPPNPVRYFTLVWCFALAMQAGGAHAEIAGLSVSPASQQCIFLGPVGGPFTPTECDFTVTNTTGSAIEVDASFSVLWEPPWIQGLVNGDVMDPFQQVRITIPAGGSIPIVLRLTDDVVGVTDPDNQGRFGGVNLADPSFPQSAIGLAGFLQFVSGNDDFVGAQLLLPQLGSVADQNDGATKEPGEPAHAGNAGGASVWYRYDAPTGAGGTLELSTERSSIDTLLAVYTGSSVDGLTLVAENDDESVSSSVSRVSVDIVPGTSYFIAVDGSARDGNGPEQGFFQLNYTENFILLNDDFSDALEVTGLAGSTTQFVSGSALPTNEAGEPAHGGGRGASVWLRWQAPATGVYSWTAGEPGIGNFPTISAYLGNAIDELIEVASTTILATATNRLDFYANAGAVYHIALTDTGLSASYAVQWTLANPQPATGLFASILPSSRAVELGQVASVFANIFNSTDQAAINCRPEAPRQLDEFTPSGFAYQTTDSLNLLSGSPNSPVDIPAGSVQNFLIEFASPAVITGGRVGIRFVCDNVFTAPLFPDVNGWILRVLPFEPADVIAIGASAGDPGVVDVPLGGNAAFAAAGVNIGAGGPILVRPEVSVSTDLQLSVCETDVSGSCLASPSPSLSIASFERNDLRTFSVFVTSGSQEIAFDPGFSRLFLTFRQGATLVGATSLAVRTQP